MLLLLKEYESRFGMPDGGGPKDQQFVLTELCARLYASGTPLWALQPVMTKAAEGLTGASGVQFLLLPRAGLVYVPTTGSTVLFKMGSGFNMHMLDSLERVLVRLASFRSNTHSVSSVPARFPDPEELEKAMQGAVSHSTYKREELAHEILNLASEGAGLFFFTRTRESCRDAKWRKSFWSVEDSTCELFSRLAALEAVESLSKINSEQKEMYSVFVITLFRLGSSAGACAIWYSGSWFDMIVGGSLGLIVALLGQSLSRHERIIFETVASFICGLTAGIIAIRFPDHTCFGAMAVTGVLDILQGFRVVYSMIELMSKQTVTGGANFLESILFTGLIAYFLRFGQYLAAEVMGDPSSIEFSKCSNGINETWYLLFIPIAALSWSGLFKPNYADLPWMCLHGVLAFFVYWAISQASVNQYLNNFIAALTVTASAALFSRFTGRQALGNTIAGLYVLLPGAYMVKSLLIDNLQQTGDYVQGIIVQAVTIGLGAWTGTLLCSPTILGTNRGLLQQPDSSPQPSMHGNIQGAMLFF
jgi:uncharacterized membrane protein YjjP (DUF1212 family)